MVKTNKLYDYMGLDDDWRTSLTEEQKLQQGLYKPSKNDLNAHGRRLLLKVVSLIGLVVLVYFTFKFISLRWGV